MSKKETINVKGVEITLYSGKWISGSCLLTGIGGK